VRRIDDGEQRFEVHAGDVGLRPDGCGCALGEHWADAREPGAGVAGHFRQAREAGVEHRYFRYGHFCRRADDRRDPAREGEDRYEDLSRVRRDVTEYAHGNGYE